MYTAIITPRAYLTSWGHLTKFHMVVPDHIKADNDLLYVRHMSRLGHYVILDNGTYERGHSITGSDLLALAEDVKADEIVVPDKFRDNKGTQYMVKQFLDENRDKIVSQKLALMIVPQGKDDRDWLNCFNNIKETLRHDRYKIPTKIIFGVPKWLSLEVNRIELVKSLRRNYTYHLLGLNNIEELQHEHNVPNNIRGIDTSLPIKAALENRELDAENPMIQDTEYFGRLIQPDQYDDAECNIVEFLRLVPDFKQFNGKKDLYAL